MRCYIILICGIRTCELCSHNLLYLYAGNKTRSRGAAPLIWGWSCVIFQHWLLFFLFCKTLYIFCLNNALIISICFLQNQMFGLRDIFDCLWFIRFVRVIYLLVSYCVLHLLMIMTRERCSALPYSQGVTFVERFI